jgi:hypothetical protein
MNIKNTAWMPVDRRHGCLRCYQKERPVYTIADQMAAKLYIDAVEAFKLQLCCLDIKSLKAEL